MSTGGAPKSFRPVFFALPGAENVSAVLFNNSGTIAKFKRMGVLAGFGSRRLKMFRKGYAVNPDPNATLPHPFQYVVNASDPCETWTEGLDVFHNPRAKHPIEPEILPDAAHHWLLKDEQIESLMPTFHPPDVVHVDWRCHGLMTGSSDRDKSCVRI